MKLIKLALTTVTATVLLGALTLPAYARYLSTSSQRIRGTWSRMDISGGFGTVECEMTLQMTLHSGTIAKVTNSLIGYVTEATVRSPCRRGGATVLREGLPWHVRYATFSGTLPNVTSISTRVTGASLSIREPTFGMTCLASTTISEPISLFFSRMLNIINAIDTGGPLGCSPFSATISGRSNSVNNGAGASVTITLI